MCLKYFADWQQAFAYEIETTSCDKARSILELSVRNTHDNGDNIWFRLHNLLLCCLVNHLTLNNMDKCW